MKPSIVGRLVRHASVVLAVAAIACARPPKAPESLADQLAGYEVKSQWDLDVELDLATEIRTGTLDNGLEWFVRPHGSPPGRVELRLAVDVGSVVERDDQLGYAHVVEHMAFNGTEAYPGTSLVRWLESQGIPFGVHINARTGFDETVYVLQVPTDDPAVVDEAIKVMAQWAGHVTFDPEEVEREKGVLIEEWRTGQGFSERMTESLLDMIFAGSVYQTRPPIGTEASLRSIEAPALREFYDDWYRPSLMGVIVVGDVDADHVQEVIEKEFSGLEDTPGAPERPRVTLPDKERPSVSVIADPEAPGTMISLFGRIEDREENTLRAYREWLVAQTVQIIAEDRLRILNRDGEGAVVRTNLGFGRITPSYTAWSASVVAPGPDRAMEALELLCIEIDRLRTHGIQEPELERARRKMKTFQRQIASRAAGGETPSGELAEELVRHYLTDEPAPDFEEMARLSEKMIDEITPEEASLWLDENLLPEENRAIQVVLPAKNPISDAEVLAAYERGFAGVPHKLQDTNIERPLVGIPPEAGEIVKREPIEGTDAVRWTLSNGAVVVFDRRTTQPERVVMVGTSPGGLGRVDPVAGLVALPVARLSGLGEHSPLVLAKLMAGRDVDVQAQIRSFSEDLEASGGTHELEAMFQLTWLRLSQNRFEPQALDRTKAFLKQALDGQRTVPENAARQVMEAKFWKDDPVFTLPSNEEIDAVTLEQAREVLSDRLESVHDWTFVITGDVTAEEVEPLVTRWIGSLPGEPGDPEQPKLDVGHPDGVTVERVVRGTTDRASFSMRMYHPVPDLSPEREMAFEALSGVLSVRLRDALREDLGGTYVPGVYGWLAERPSPEWVQAIQFQCDPARVDELRAVVTKELARLREEGVTEEELETQRKLMVREWELEQRQITSWAERLLAAERRGTPAAKLFDVKGLAESMTTAQLQELAKQFLVEEPRVEVVLVPETADSGE